MQLLQYTLLTFVVAFFLQYWVLSVITSNRPQNTMGKFYLSMVSASIMGILEVMIYDSYKNVVSLFFYLVLALALYLFIYLFKQQIGIDDVDYLKQMLESHSRDVLLSDMAAKKTTNIHVQRVANNIIERRKRDIDVIDKMLDDDLKKAPVTQKNLFTYMSPFAKPVQNHMQNPVQKPVKNPFAEKTSII